MRVTILVVAAAESLKFPFAAFLGGLCCNPRFPRPAAGRTRFLTTLQPGGYLYFEASSIPSVMLVSMGKRKIAKLRHITFFYVEEFHDGRCPDCYGDDLTEGPYLGDQAMSQK